MSATHRPFLMGLLTGGLVVAAFACAASAEATHLAQLGSCVDRYTTRSEIDLCRAEVELAWGRLPDGGRVVDGGAQ